MTSSPGRKFIFGLPMKPATNRFAGRLNSSSGVPCCRISPSDITTIRCPRVIASVWSWVT